MPNVGLRRAFNCLLAGILGRRCPERGQKWASGIPPAATHREKSEKIIALCNALLFLGPNREGTDLCKLRAVYEVQEKMQSGFECMNWKSVNCFFVQSLVPRAWVNRKKSLTRIVDEAAG